MTDLRQAAQQALDALVLWQDEAPYAWSKADADAITALRTALEQQAEPSQWRDMVVVNLVREGVNKHKARELADHFATPPQQQAEPVQERITHITWDERGVRTVNGIPDDAPHRPWVGLTDEEITELDMEISGRTMDECVRAIEAKLKERNT